MFVKSEEIQIENYDYIIVGSGPAGATLAKQLINDNKLVLMIETGGREYDSYLQEAYSYVHGVGHYTTEHWPGHWIRALGGTSAVWSGMVRPLTERNLKTWPLFFKDLEPFYDDASRLLGRNPEMTNFSRNFSQNFKFLPFSYEEPLRLGSEENETFWKTNKLHVLLNTTLTNLEINDAKTLITNITLFTASKQYRRFKISTFQKVILAAGGIGNAQILMGSAKEHQKAIGNQYDQVGRYLMEHPHFFNCAKLFLRDPITSFFPPKSFGDFIPAVSPDDDTYSKNGSLDVSFELEVTELDINEPIIDHLFKKYHKKLSVYDVHARSEMLADPENRLEVIHGRDPSGLPRLRATCILNAADQRSILRNLQSLGENVHENNFGRLLIIPEPIFDDVLGGGHIMGTTRMGDSPKNSVVDQNCRVHGIVNLYVLGSSVFRTGGYANPTMTIVALACKLAEHLRSK